MSELQPGMVTIADLYRELTGLRADVARALTRIEVIDSRNADADKAHADYESRLRVLEAFRWKLAGMAIVISVICGLASGYLAWLLERR